MDDMSVIDIPAVPVAYRGETLTISPLTVGQIPSVLKHARPILDAIAGQGKSPAPVGGGVGTKGKVKPAKPAKPQGFELSMKTVMVLVEDHAEDLFHICAIATEKPVDWLKGNRNLGEFVLLVFTLIEVNQDFFAQQVAPILAQMGLAIGVGPTRSKS